MLGKQTCSFLENILVLITFGSLLFISLLIDIKGVVKSVGFAWSGGGKGELLLHWYTFCLG